MGSVLPLEFARLKTIQQLIIQFADKWEAKKRKKKKKYKIMVI